MRWRAYWAAGLAIAFFAPCAWSQVFVRVGGGGVRVGLGSGGRFSPRIAPSGHGGFSRGARFRPFGVGVGFHPRRFNRFLLGGYGGYYPYYPMYPYDYASPCCGSCSCDGGETYYAPEESEEARAYHPPIFPGPVQPPPDPATLRAALARRYPRHVMVHFDDQGLAEGETPLEIPSKPPTVKNDSPENP